MSSSPKNRGRPFRLTDRDIAVIVEAFNSRALSRDAMIRLGFFHSVQRANARLALLVAYGYLQRIMMPKGTGTESVYLLASASVGMLAERLDFDRAEIARVARRDPARSYIEHSMLLVEIRLLLELAANGAGISVVTFMHEAEARHEYSVAVGGRLRRRIIKPDAYFSLVIGTDRVHFFLEGDRGTVSSRQEACTFRSYRQYLDDGAFSQAYGADRFTVLHVTTAGSRRVKHLAPLTKEMEGPDLSYRFATLADVRRLGFLGVCWVSRTCPDSAPLFAHPEVGP